MKQIFFITFLFNFYLICYAQKVVYIVNSNASDAAFNNNIRNNLLSINDRKKIKTLTIYRADLSKLAEFKEITNIYNSSIFLDKNGNNCPSSSIDEWIACVNTNYSVHYDLVFYICDDKLENVKSSYITSENFAKEIKSVKIKKKHTIAIFHYKKPTCNKINSIPSVNLPISNQRYPLVLFNPNQPGSHLGYFFSWRNNQNMNVRLSLVMDDCMSSKSNPSIDIDIYIQEEEYLLNENGYYKYFLTDVMFSKLIREHYKLNFDDVKQNACTWTVKLSYFCESENERQYSNAYTISSVQFFCCE